MMRAGGEVERWLLEAALPLWWQRGADRVNGGFHDSLALDGTAVIGPRRARSIARMVYSWCEAPRLGWCGPWREAAQHALADLKAHFIRADGTVRAAVSASGTPHDDRFDLYEQAFALLAFASAHSAFGASAGWREAAVTLRTTLATHFHHPLGGYREDRDGAILPLRANPHMHLLEAALAWMSSDRDPDWRALADEIATLCLTRFIDPATGALRELYDNDWTPSPGVEGRLCEPGHHYEWAFLLDRWARLTGGARPTAVSQLIAFADRHGCDHDRGVVVNAVLDDGTIHDPVARLWAQAERIRAYAVTGRSEQEIASAVLALRRYLATPTPGLWFDQLGANGVLVQEPARATSLYHIIGAVAALDAACSAPSGQAGPPPPGGGRSTAEGGRVGVKMLRHGQGAAKVHPTLARNASPPSPSRGGWTAAQPFTSDGPAPDVGTPRRVVYLVTEDWYFVSHRLPMARAARAAGFEVHVATRVDHHGDAITAEGFHLHPISWRRGSLDPRDLARVVREVRALYRRIAPDLAHHVALPATVVGSLAATGLPVVCLNAMTGLGTMFSGDGTKVRVVRAALTAALRRLLRRERAAVLVQNDDDRALIAGLGVDPARIALIPGSGVDVTRLRPAPEPEGPVTVAFVGRLLESKGVRTLIAAFDLLAARGRDIALLVAGTPDPGNAGSLTAEEIAAWTQRPNIRHLGFVEDVAGLWARAHIAVLPSDREGLPLSLLEAAACGRPIVATDVPGCRAIARAGVNGLLVPRGDAVALADAIARLADDPALRARLGAASRAMVEQEFASDRIGPAVVALYEQLLAAKS
ncbi:MAG: AGE family epimerase/isomerase [Hyphomicrobiales bacterium]|nr:AGE family epimerase/isomerase [Hyphomicrobiales bacterium]